MKTVDELYKQCKKLQIFIFSKKTEKMKNLKKQRKKCAGTPIYTYYYLRLWLQKLIFKAALFFPYTLLLLTEELSNFTMAENWCANQKYYLSFSSFTCFIPYIILFCSNGLDKKKSKYMRLTIDINYKNCLYLRKKSKKERWKVICSRGDPECYGSNECNAIECKNPDKMKKLDLGTKSYKHI